MLARTVQRYGLPLAVYSDRHTIFVHARHGPIPLADQLAGRAVVVEERLDGRLWVGYRGTHRPLLPAPPGPVSLRARRSGGSDVRPD